MNLLQSAFLLCRSIDSTKGTGVICFCVLHIHDQQRLLGMSSFILENRACIDPIQWTGHQSYGGTKPRHLGSRLHTMNGGSTHTSTRTQLNTESKHFVALRAWDWKAFRSTGIEWVLEFERMVYRGLAVSTTRAVRYIMIH
jgi:hypothetical protein